ncbi:ORF5 [Bemisia tabaci arlivirus 2]|uniref:ORF5 n=1 Tax=Bemisia tabaci arlivirus 2 TaxID=2840018 RepID=A0A8E8KRV1_9MONO|nr:ORF5 [Bemisia tabaci arlivirus 2]QWC36465.1 ORF5 [Bemisia tabaci arlivirus 2]
MTNQTKIPLPVVQAGKKRRSPPSPGSVGGSKRAFVPTGYPASSIIDTRKKSTLEHLAVMLDAQMATISVLNNQISQISQRSFDRGNPNSIISRLERIEQKMATPNQDRSRSTMRARSASVHRIYPKK